MMACMNHQILRQHTTTLRCRVLYIHFPSTSVRTSTIITTPLSYSPRPAPRARLVHRRNASASRSQA